MARGGKENVFFGQLPNKWRASGGENDVRNNNIVVTFPRPPLPQSHTPSTPTIPKYHDIGNKRQQRRNR